MLALTFFAKQNTQYLPPPPQTCVLTLKSTKGYSSCTKLKQNISRKDKGVLKTKLARGEARFNTSTTVTMLLACPDTVSDEILGEAMDDAKGSQVKAADAH